MANPDLGLAFRIEHGRRPDQLLVEKADRHFRVARLGRDRHRAVDQSLKLGQPTARSKSGHPGKLEDPTLDL